MAFELDPCRVYAGSGELLAEGFVREHDGDLLVVEAEGFTGVWLDAGDGAVVQVMSAVKGECTYDALVRSSAPRRIGLTGLRLREAVQKRAAVRVPTSLPHRVTHRVEGRERVELDEPLDVVVLDVSAHGMRLGCAQEIDAGTTLALEFTAARRPLDLTLTVLRNVPTRSGFAHGCRLEGIDERGMDELFTFVLTEQRRQRALRMDVG